ncbi:DUF4233 domain-containing protein [Mycobacterium sp. NBC_00419]|uniref:DUF4233 domain-containing protein n=1 Tax=Mycobacterium sp. NBC_00419 TaxID=2975989 RepID=UPI002E1EBA16
MTDDTPGPAAPQPNVAGPAAPPDPWKSFRGVMAGTLILEAIVVLLALPVVGSVGGGLTAWSTAYLVGFAVLLILLAGVQGKPWAIWMNLGVQFVLVAGFAVYPAVGFIGVLFVVVWAVIAYLRAEVLRRQRRGLLPGQQRPPD